MNLASLVGYHDVTYRQLDHWIAKGWIPGGNPGSGNERWLSPEQTAVARAMARLVHAGVRPDTAARLAPLALKGKPVKYRSVIFAFGPDTET